MKNSIEAHPQFWVALTLGNTHWQWGYFENATLKHHWKTKPQPPSSPLNWVEFCALSPALAWHHRCDRPAFPPLYIASVLTNTPPVWLQYPGACMLSLADLPITGLYDTLGLDRALAVLGAGDEYGWPILVIDAGTALTFSGADAGHFVGGAIAPGLGLQLQMLTDQTSALPAIPKPSSLPPRWALNTPEAIASGVIHSILDSIIAFHRQWEYQYPQSNTVLTGGDGKLLLQFLDEQIRTAGHPLRSNNTVLSQTSGQTSGQTFLNQIFYDEHLIFKGISQCLSGPRQ